VTKQRIAIIGILSLLTFGLLFGGQLIYKKHWADADLLQKVEQVKGIEEASIVRSPNGRFELQVKTEKVDDLQQLAEELLQHVEDMPIIIIDNRSAELEALYDQMQFAIHEGLVQGNFTAMADRLRQLAEQANAEIDLTMDHDNIYLSLSDGDHQLLSIVERHGQGIFYGP